MQKCGVHLPRERSPDWNQNVGTLSHSEARDRRDPRDSAWRPLRPLHHRLLVILALNQVNLLQTLDFLRPSARPPLHGTEARRLCLFRLAPLLSVYPPLGPLSGYLLAWCPSWHDHGVTEEGLIEGTVSPFHVFASATLTEALDYLQVIILGDSGVGKTSLMNQYVRRPIGISRATVPLIGPHR